MSEESSRLSNSKLSTLPTPTYACPVPRESTASPLPRGTSHSDQDHQSAGWLFGAERCWNKDLPRDMANDERYPVVDYRCSVCKGILTIDDDTSKGHRVPATEWLEPGLLSKIEPMARWRHRGYIHVLGLTRMTEHTYPSVR